MIFKNLILYFLVICTVFFITSFGFSEIGYKPPEILIKKEMKLIGLEKQIDVNDIPAVGALWNQLNPRYGEIKNRSDIFNAIGVYQSAPGIRSIFVGVEVNNFDFIPAGMTAKTVPAQEYAVFTHHGLVSEIQNTYDHIFQEWFPHSDFVLDNTQSLEEYGFWWRNGNDSNSEMKIYIPIILKKADFSIIKGSLKPSNNPLTVGMDIYSMPIHKDEYIFKSKIIEDQFRIEVVTPVNIKPGYHCPVIYLTDGHYNEPQFKYILYLAWKKIIPPVIVVGIGYPGGYDYNKTRERDLVDQPEKFKRLIDEEVCPAVESGYSCDPSKRILIGASYGGYFVLESLLSDIISNKNLYYGYLAGSPGFRDETIFKQTLDQINHLEDSGIKWNTRLYITAGYLDYVKLVNNAWSLITTINPATNKELSFNNCFYPNTDHYQSTRMSMIDGVRLFLAEGTNRGTGFQDIKYPSMTYTFSQPVELLDWSFLYIHNGSALTNLTLANKEGVNSVRADCCFTGDVKAAVLSTTFDHFEDMTGKTVNIKILVPEDLAKLKYSFSAGVSSTYNWITELSQPLEISQSGWQTFTFHINELVKKGKTDLVRKIEFHLIRPDQSKTWSGSFNVSAVHWE